MFTGHESITKQILCVSHACCANLLQVNVWISMYNLQLDK